MDSSLDIQKVLGLLADGERFKVLASIALGADTLEKIAGMTGLESQSIVKSLVKLEGAGLITKTETGYVFNMETLQAASREYGRIGPRKSPPTGIERFMKDGKIITYPSRPDDQLMVLEYVAGLFEVGREYYEKSVNEMIKTVFDDYASMRRYLSDKGFFRREVKTGENYHSITQYLRIR